MSNELICTIDNARYLLPSVIPEFTKGPQNPTGDGHGIAALYRSRGVSELLLRGVPDPLFIAQMQATSAYVFALGRTHESEKVTSMGGCFWDAVSAQYWEAAREIATLSRMTHNAKREHEDDFLYVAFLMQRYLLAPLADAPAEEIEAHERAQAQRLERWEEVVGEALDSRLILCHALRDHDAEAFAETIVALAEERDEDLEWRLGKGALTKEEVAWLMPIWPEGLALLRFAERDGLSIEGLEVPRVPALLRVDNPYLYNPKAWQSAEFQPGRRRS